MKWYEKCERKTGLEPATYSLEGCRSTKWATSAGEKKWERKDSNLRRLSQQIYSLSHLTALELSQRFSLCALERADSRTWTNDRLITNQLLYQLSYIGTALSKNSLLFRGRKNSLFYISRNTCIAFFLFFYVNCWYIVWYFLLSILCRLVRPWFFWLFETNSTLFSE